MKKYLTCAIIALVALTLYLTKQLDTVKGERDSFQRDKSSLLEGQKEYQTRDSLNVVSVKALQLTLKEYKQHRVDDAKVIDQLKIKNGNLSNVITSNSKTISNLEAKVKQSLVYIDSLGNEVDKGSEIIYKVDTLQCLDIKNKWFTLDGCIRNEVFKGTLINYDSLVIGATIEHKRFLGFLWKTSKIKSQQIDVVSKNPNTKIQSAEFIIIQ